MESWDLSSGGDWMMNLEWTRESRRSVNVRSLKLIVSIGKAKLLYLPYTVGNHPALLKIWNEISFLLLFKQMRASRELLRN
jgi:hypothetical protein